MFFSISLVIYVDNELIEKATEEPHVNITDQQFNKRFDRTLTQLQTFKKGAKIVGDLLAVYLAHKRTASAIW
jgi:hypothetical protein